MSTTVGKMSATVGGNVCNSGEIGYALRNLRLKFVIHNYRYITSEDTWNNMSKGFEEMSFRSESISWDLTICFFYYMPMHIQPVVTVQTLPFGIQV